MKVLVACEESQAVCIEGRKLGHEVYSCDIQEPSGGHPEWHILGDALVAMKGGQIVTMDGRKHDVGKWDLMIAHPPCTYLTVTGNRWFNVERYGDAAINRLANRHEAVNFFMEFALSGIPKIAIENPVGCMSTAWRKPDQIIHPYMEGTKLGNYFKSMHYADSALGEFIDELDNKLFSIKTMQQRAAEQRAAADKATQLAEKAQQRYQNKWGGIR